MGGQRLSTSLPGQASDVGANHGSCPMIGWSYQSRVDPTCAELTMRSLVFIVLVALETLACHVIVEETE